METANCNKELTNKMNTIINTDDKEELIEYIKQALDSICNTVRNKMVAPYTILKTTEGNSSAKELIDVSLKDINWLCHQYLPNISSEVISKYKEISKV